jgi:hypothetical protein
MSKGLGKVERFVLDELPTGRTLFGTQAGQSVGGIATQMGHTRWLAENGQECQDTRECCELGPYAIDTPWRAEYESVRRAVRSLERKGLVRTHWQADDQGPTVRPTPYLRVYRTAAADSLRTAEES